MSTVVRLLRLASFCACVVVITSFAFFALDQTRSASDRQREAVNSSLVAANPQASVAQGSIPAAAPRRSPLRATIDDASRRLTSPFTGVISAASGEWAERGVELLLALAIYGFGLAYLARALRVRV